MVWGEALRSRRWRRKSSAALSTMVRPIVVRPIVVRGCLRSSVIECPSSILCLGARMVLDVHTLQAVERYVGIDLRRRNVRVAEDGLHGAEIGSILDHVRCAGVTQHVRAGVTAGGETRVAYQPPDALPGQAPGSRAQKQERRVLLFGDHLSGIFQVLL